MKITKKDLQRIIKEEIRRVVEDNRYGDPEEAGMPYGERAGGEANDTDGSFSYEERALDFDRIDGRPSNRLEGPSKLVAAAQAAFTAVKALDDLWDEELEKSSDRGESARRGRVKGEIPKSRLSTHKFLRNQSYYVGEVTAKMAKVYDRVRRHTKGRSLPDEAVPAIAARDK